jgi:ABC-type transporter Mla maintaining outer membrane lipid asymmetry ATPase subunit MlaF
VTSVVVTHELDLCFAISDRVALLAEGTLVAKGEAEAIRSSTQEEVRDFLAGGNDLEADDVWLTSARQSEDEARGA